MDTESIKEYWREFCFLLSETVGSDISEKDLENQIVRAIERLGWNEYKGEIERQPRLQIGRNQYIKPDLVIRNNNEKALIVIEVKRPTEDLSKDGGMHQLISYMRQMKTEFGLLIGNQIHLYYDGPLNKRQEPLVLEKFSFENDSEKGLAFIKLFNKSNFINDLHFPYVKRLIDNFNERNNLKILKKNLPSENTKNKILQFLKDEFSEYGSEIIDKALSDIEIKITIKQPPSLGNSKSSITETNKVIPQEIKEYTSDNDLKMDRVLNEIVPALKSMNLNCNINGYKKSVNFKIGDYKLVLSAKSKERCTLTVFSDNRSTEEALNDFILTEKPRSNETGNRKARIPLTNMDKILNSIRGYHSKIQMN